MKKAPWTFYFGIFLFLFLIAVALIGPLFAPEGFDLPRLAEQLRAPSMAHWFGQDHNGADVFWHVILGTRISLYVGLVSVTVSLFVGTIIGAISGYFGGVVDSVIMRIVDVFMAFPGFLLAITVAAVLGPGINNLIFALSIVSWVTFARLTRAQFLSLKEQDFVMAAKAMGVSHVRTIFRHILPLCIAPLTVQTTFALAGAILTEASLSFLGLGAPPDVPSWGRMLSHGARYILKASHPATFPGIAIMVTVLALNFIGDGLRDRLDVRDS